MRISDWSSDVCSSDLQALGGVVDDRAQPGWFAGGLKRSGGLEMQPFSRFTGEGARRADEGARAKRSAAFDVCLCWMQEQEQLAALAPSSGASRHLLPQAGEGLGWCPWALRSEEHTSELQSLMRI